MNPDHLTNIQIAITSLFKVKKLEHGIVRLSHGAQFSTQGNIFGVFLSLFLIAIAIVAIINGSLLPSFFIVPICGVIVAYALDIQGIEIDTHHGKVRNYKSFFGYRSGEWQNINQFNQLVICRNSILEKRTIDRGSTYASSHSYDTHNFFTLYLVDDNERHYIKLHEEESITRIRIIATKLSELGKLRLNTTIISKKPEVI